MACASGGDGHYVWSRRPLRLEATATASGGSGSQLVRLLELAVEPTMVSGDTDEVRVDCSRCTHLLITHDADRPRGCRAYGFSCREVPSSVVIRMSGLPCQHYEIRQGPDQEPPFKPKRKPGGLYG